jgi:hypothetical protein
VKIREIFLKGKVKEKSAIYGACMKSQSLNDGGRKPLPVATDFESEKRES